jgi:glycosyltransferase involved in cell wall biosynthesis
LNILVTTLNAITALSNSFEEVIVITRNVSLAEFDFKGNVVFKKSGNYADIRDTEKASVKKKAFSFFEYTSLLLKNIRAYKPDVLLVYDSISLFALWLIRRLIPGKYILWYHSHDTSDIHQLRKYSIAWWSVKYENTILIRHVNIFSLPSLERKKFFALDKFKGNFFFIPNFPSISFFTKFYEPKHLGSIVKLIFQGSVGEGHGLENVSRLLDREIQGREIQLVIKGWIRDENFRKKLTSIATAIGRGDGLHFIPFGPYKDLPLVTRECHIGIGIHSLNTDLHTTLANASNKLYEYAALGLPIIVYDSSHYREHLKKYDWVFFASDDIASLQKCITVIIGDYDRLSRSAHASFLEEFNFESKFEPVIDFLMLKK